MKQAEKAGMEMEVNRRRWGSWEDGYGAQQLLRSEREERGWQNVTGVNEFFSPGEEDYALRMPVLNVTSVTLMFALVPLGGVATSLKGILAPFPGETWGSG